MGRINDAVPFFGKGFNKIYPLIMVIYTSLIAGNIFDRVIKYCGNWKIFKLNDDAEDMDGFDPSGVIILQRGEFKPFQLLQHPYFWRSNSIASNPLPFLRTFSTPARTQSW